VVSPDVFSKLKLKGNRLPGEGELMKNLEGGR